MTDTNTAVKEPSIKVECTGNYYSIASSEFLITFPDGETETIWSPPWHEMTKEEEMQTAIEIAHEMWDNKQSGLDIEANDILYKPL